MKNIVILGGSYAGVSTAHRILKQAAKTGPFKITLVSPNTHFYWSMASPRAIIPGQFTDEMLFRPVADGFKQYPASQFEFIVASAETLNVETKKVGIVGAGDARTLDYDYLIIATGARSTGDAPFKVLGSTKATKDALHDYQTRVQNAKKIVIAGTGVTGVETAGELAFEYGKKKEIILIGSGTKVLEGTPESVSKLTTKELHNLNVNIKLETRIISSTQLPNGQQELTLSNGQKLTTDMYIPTFGLIPNSSFVPIKYLNNNGTVKVDEYLRVKGVNAVWAIGDVSDIEPAQMIHTDKQSTYLAKNFLKIMSNTQVMPYKVTTSRMTGFQIGKKAGTGHFGNMKMPSFVIVRVRKNLFIEKIGPTVDGSQY